MSAEPLSFTIVLPKRDYHAGEDVKGHLEVNNLDDSVRDIEMWLEWRTTGEGDSVSGHTDHEQLSVTTRAIGGRARPTFTLKVPKAPLSYAGKRLAIEWFVVAEADIAWARDPRVEAEIVVRGAELVRPTPATQMVLKPGYLMWRASPLANTLGVVGMGISTTVLTAATGGVVAAAVGLGVVGLYALYHSRSAQRTRVLGPPTLVFDPGALVVGRPWKLRLACKPTIALANISAKYKLSVEERVTVGSGKTQHTDVDVRWSTSNALGAKSPAPQGRELFFDVVVNVPEGIPATFTHPHHKLLWQLGVTITFAPVDGEPIKLDYVVPVTARR